ncbi:hypothetical protein NDU88_005201 [Pleurodeles waltl]|uniref:Uncharacterized protein n=1 Tax=Pleurodeles waltl TaxID=8319 RepID=A0AAV7UHC8_PLEWA|nr:hypothetical protein NDU88_005201 [Pleurodeles waltl]
MTTEVVGKSAKPVKAAQVTEEAAKNDEKKIKKGFPVSEVNQGEIRDACVTLEKKFDLLAIRTQALEESVGTMKEELGQNKEEIQLSKGNERERQEKLEHLENNSRRNNLRVLNVPDRVEGDDLKRYVASLIKNAVSLDEVKKEIASDIQRIHRDS